MRRGRRSLTAVVLALVAWAGLCSGLSAWGLTPSGLAAAPKSGAATTLSWHDCGGGFQCANLAVPLSYAHPNGRTISLALARFPSSSRGQKVGSLLINPGGPGASGIQFLREVAGSFAPDVLDRFDIVSWDPRGVGQSDPVECESGPALDRFFSLPAAPATPAEVSAVVSATKAFDEGCVRRSGLALLRNISTEDTARDLDRIRAALGDSKLTYLGFSYGTFIGAMYAHLFPTHIRAMVLDGAVDPALTTEQEDVQQAEGFETDLNDFLSWCQAGNSCALDQAGGVQAAFQRVLGRLQEGPVPTGHATQPSLDAGLGFYGLAEGLYSTSTWPQLAEALAAVLHNNGSQLLGLANQYTGRNANGTYQNILEADTAISCLDKPSPTSLASYEADAASWARVAPTFGPSEAWGPLSCAYWPVPPVEQAGPLSASGAPPIVVVGSTNDPATPYSWAQALAGQLSAVLVTRVGAGHTGYFFSNCVEQVANTYLINLKVPQPGVTCQS
jgi:pimeloyl-ACP methyl ester carboxylesterase